MKRIFLFLVLFSAAFIQTSCTSTVHMSHPKRSIWRKTSFSILGDSYSTFEGFVTPQLNDVWYHLPPDNYIDVTQVSQMWWHQVQDTMNWKLKRNNSFSGSVLCNWDTTNYYGPHSFIRRADDLGNPDVIFVFGGTNDVWQKAPIGNYQYGNWSDEDLCSFRPGLAFLCQKLKRYYPSATIWFLIDMELSPEIIDSFHTILSHYQMNHVDLYDISKDWMHPTAAGMKPIASQTLKALTQ